MNLRKILRRRLSTRQILIVGSLAWLVPLAAWRASVFETEWARLLLLLAPLVLVPMGLDKVGVPLSWSRLLVLWQILKQLTLPAALSLVVSCWLEPGWPAAALAAPWLVVCGLIAWVGANRLAQHPGGPIHEVCFDFALIFLVVGAAWAVCDRLGYRPLGFDPVIVLLTAIHFHYAGFALTLIAGLVLRENKGRLANVTGAALLVGVALVAAGITLSHLGLGTWAELLSAWVLAAAALVVAALQARLGFKVETSRQVKALWLVSSCSLAASMALAALYGSRFVLPVAWLDIPWMRALHGTANALGFGLMGLLGWWLRR